MSKSRRLGILVVLSILVLGMLPVGLGPTPARAASTITLDNACGKLVLDEAEPGDPNVIVALPGDTIQLTADSLCDGDGIAVEAEGVTLDLNGFDIISKVNVAAIGEALGQDLENHGIAVGAKNSKVTNNNLTPGVVSVISNFTSNVDIAKAESSFLVGKLIGGAYNIKIGASHGGGGIAVDRSRGITIDTVEIEDTNTAAVPEGGDNGIDWKRCSGGGNQLKNSRIVAPLAALRMRGCRGGDKDVDRALTIDNTSFGTADPLLGIGIEFTRDVEGVKVSNSTIGPNGEIGVGIGAATKNITFVGNTILNNVQCGIDIDPTAQLPQTDAVLLASNTFSLNGEDICHYKRRGGPR